MNTPVVGSNPVIVPLLVESTNVNVKGSLFGSESFGETSSVIGVLISVT